MAHREIIGPGTFVGIHRGKVAKPVEVYRQVEAPVPPGTVRVGKNAEYVSEAKFGKLGPAEQAYLKKQGIEAFNIEQKKTHRMQVRQYEEAVAAVEEQKAQQEKWGKENIVKVGPGKDPFLRATLEAMTPAAQKLLKEVGLTEFNRQAEVARREFEAQFTPQEISEIQAGKYRIYSYETNEFVPVTRKIYEEREEYYRLMPMVGPPGAPGKITPTEAKATYEAQQSILRELDAGGFYLGALKPGEYGPEVPPELRQYSPTDALQAGFDEAKLRKIFGDETIGETKSYMKALVTLAPYKTAEGYDLLAAVKAGVTKVTLSQVFEPDIVKPVMEAKQAAIETGVALPGEVMWENRLTGEHLTETQFKQVIKTFETKRDTLIKGGKMFTEEWSELGGHPQDIHTKTVPEVKRMAVVGLSTFVFMPSRMLLPEVKAADIQLIEYGIGAAQLATWAMPFMPKGILPLVSAGASGMFGFTTAQNWGRLSPGEKVLSVVVTALVAAPAIGSIAKGFRPVTIRTPMGEAKVWPVISVKGKPVIGLSSGTKRVLSKMGVPETEITRLVRTLEETGGFAGKKSPYAVEADLAATKTLSQEGVAEVFTATRAAGKKIDKVYGSTTIKPQLAPELRQWRKPGDIDVQTAMSQADTEAFTQSLAKSLQRTDKVRVASDNPTLIEVRGTDGQWHHAVDVHSRDIGASAYEQYPTSAYGFEFQKPAITIEYPGIGKVRIMRLDESGIRKMSGITEWQTGPVTMGRIGPYASDAAAISAVAKGTKPVATMQLDVFTRLRVTTKGLKTVPDPADPHGVIVFRDTVEGRAAVNVLMEAQKNYPRLMSGKMTPAEQIQYHVKSGEALGYVTDDIATFLAENYPRELIGKLAPGYVSKTVMGPVLGPAAHRGKDIVDYYVILRTFKGAQVADDWARAFGLDPDELLALAKKTPPELTAWEFIPATAKASPGAVPSMAVHLPDLVRALAPAVTVRPLSVAVAEAYTRLATLPPVVSPAVVSPLVSPAVSPAISPPAVSPLVVSPKVVPSVAVVKPSVSPRVPKKVSPRPSPPVTEQSIASLVLSPRLAPSKPVSPPSKPVSKPVSPPSVPVSKPVSKPVSIPVTPVSIPVSIPVSVPSKPISPPYTPPYSPPYEPPYVPHKPPPKLVPPPILKEAEAKRKTYEPGTIVWRQGAWWKIIPPPYDIKKPMSSRTPPKGVTITKGTPQETLAFIDGVIPPRNISFDLGVVDGYIDVAKRRIVFTGYGEETDVGLRLPSPTKGLTLRRVVPVRLYKKPTRVRKASLPQVKTVRIFE